MAEYNIPGDAKEFFANGEEQYSIIDHEQSGDNIFAMQLFLECVDIPDEMIEEDDGTQVVLSNGTKRLVIDSYGLGNFDRHGYDVTVAEDQPATEARDA